ncbi:MAG: translation elongation factor Ts [Patescibacteria group bacterium]|jgi:elongation factor Ts
MMEQIKQLRDKTGCGISDCKKALEETGGDIDKAAEVLRKKGIAKAAKRADREASEGIILAAVNENNTEGYMLEVNSETDFVARNEKFQDFANKVFTILKEKKCVSAEELLGADMENSNVKEQLESFSGVIGEKLEIRNAAVIKNEAGTVGSYLHMGGKIGILISLNKPGQKELAIDMAMQVAAANPKYLKPEDMPSEELEKEKEIYREQLSKEGKPEEMIEKIIVGKINKYYGDVCLIKQEYIKDDKIKVEEVLGDAKILEYIRFSLS